jgi:hypothetical protein
MMGHFKQVVAFVIDLEKENWRPDPLSDPATPTFINGQQLTSTNLTTFGLDEFLIAEVYGTLRRSHLLKKSLLCEFPPPNGGCTYSPLGGCGSEGMAVI